MKKNGKLRDLWKDRKNQSKYIKWLMIFARPYWFKILLVMSSNIFTSVITLGMAIVSKKIIDDAVKGTRNTLLYTILIYFGMILLTQLFGVIMTLVSTMLNEKFSFSIRKQVYEKILASCWLSVQKYHTGDLMTRLTSDTGIIADGIVTTIPQIFTLMVELVLVFLTLFYYSPFLACFALLIAPVAVIVGWWFGKKLKILQVKVQESEAAYRSFLQESMANLLIMKAFSNEEYAANRLVELRENRFYWVWKRTKFGVVSSTSMSMSFQLGYIVAFTYGALQIAEGVITYGTMSVFLTLVNRVQAPIMQLAQQIPKVVAVLSSVGRIIELQDIKVENYEKTEFDPKQVGISLEHVHFGYTDEPVLQDVSFDVKPGETIAIIGESGIGKTTLIRLVLSFVKATSGQVVFYNVMGQKMSVNAGCREFISYVPQGNTLFSGTIRENIRMGRLDATEEEMLEALKMVAGYDFVMNLPKGIDTVIGEKGHGLSEGQAQRIAIARALVRKAPVLILDEATSALDENTEVKVLQGISQYMEKPTCLIITHRKSVLKYCTKELIIEDKKVILQNI